MLPVWLALQIRFTMWYIGLGLACLRPIFVFKKYNPHIERSYQAFSHIVVGWLFASWMLLPNGHFSGDMFLWMSGVEVICAVLSIVVRKHEKGEDWLGDSGSSILIPLKKD